MTNRTRRVVHGGIVSVGQCHRISSSGGQLFNIHSQKLIIGPPGSGAIAIRVGRGVTSKPGRCAQHPGMGPIVVLSDRINLRVLVDNVVINSGDVPAVFRRFKHV